MYHKPRMCRTCLQMSRGDFKFVNLDSVDPLWESNSPNLKEQLTCIVPEMKLDSTETFICTSCFIALRTAYEFKRMCLITEQKFQNYNYKYRRPFGVGPGSPQFHVTLNENNNSASSPYRCQNLNYLQTDTSIDITEHHLYDASKVLPRKQLAYLNNVSQKLPEIDVEVIMGQNSDKSDKKSAATEDSKDNKNDKLEPKLETKIEKKVEPKPQIQVETKTKTEKKVEAKPDTKIEKKVEVKPQIEIKTEKKETKIEKKETKTEKKETKIEKKIENKPEIKLEKVPKEEREEKKDSVVQKDVKPKPILPNLPGIEIVPKKLNSVELRKKYNIGSQISILKTPKQASVVDSVIKKACEEIPYLKTNNILPEALNCSVRLEILTSQLTTRVTAEKYTPKEMEELAKLYYAECGDTLLDCKFCKRSFSTEHWLKVHEEEHTKPKRVDKPLYTEKKKDPIPQVQSIAVAPTPIDEPAKPLSVELVKASSVEPVKASSVEPVKVSLVEPVKASSVEPVKASSVEPVEASSVEPVEAPLVEPVEASLVEPVKASIVEPIKPSSVEPVRASFVEPIKPSSAEPVKEPAVEPVQAPSVEPVKALSVEPVKAPLMEPVKEPSSNTNKIAIPPQLQNDQISIVPIQKSSINNTKQPAKIIEKLMEPSLEPEVSLSTVKKSPPVIINSSEISLIKADNKIIIKTLPKDEEIKSIEKEVPQIKTLIKTEPIQEETEQSISLPPKVSVDDKIEIKQEAPKEVVTTTTIKPEPEIECAPKPKLPKRLWKKNKITGLKYLKCYVCLKHFRSKLSLYQHCKFIHIPNVLSSNYWYNFISHLKEQQRKQKIEEVEEEEEEEEEEVEESKHTIPMRSVKAKRVVAEQHICNICDKQLKQASHLVLHMYVHTPTFVSMDPDSRPDENSDVFRCYLCEKTFPKERYLKLHNLQVHLTKPVICKVCNREFKSEFWFSRHKCVIPAENPEPEEAIEEEGKEISCTLCDRKFARLRFMKSHRKRMHKDILEKSNPSAVNDTHDSIQDRNDSEESEHSGYESNQEYDLPNDDTKEVVNNDLNSKRRSLSRGVPKIQCDFCGEYIEETIYDKHIFEHNKLRLNKSLSKRKSLETNADESLEKKETFIKCHICFKSFKRRHNFNTHMLTHGEANFEHVTADSTHLSEAEEDESEAFLSDGEIQEENLEAVNVNITPINGVDMHVCCGRPFRLKAHFFRHFKNKHLHCKLRLHYKGETYEGPLEQTLANININQMDYSVEQLDETQNEQSIKDDTADEITDSKVLDEFKINDTEPEVAGGETLPIETVKIESDPLEEAPRKRRKYTRRTYPLDGSAKKNMGLRRIQKSVLPADDEKDKDLNDPLSTSNHNKRKLSLDPESDDVRKPGKTPKLLKKPDEQGEEIEDLAATALHLRQLDLLPVTSKTAGGYECHVCAKKFKQKCQLRDHFNVHTGERPYKCDFCIPSKGFTQTSSLYVHFRRVHAVVTKNCSWEVYAKNGDCLICSELFFKHSQMFDHMKTYYVQNEFECHLCMQKFNMTCHFKKHNIDPEEMQHLFVKEEVSGEEGEEILPENEQILPENEQILPENEQILPENEQDEKMQSDTERMSEVEDDAGKGSIIRCSKCDKTFTDKQQLRFHKKSLAHFQQIQAKRRKTKVGNQDHVEEEDADASIKAETTDTIEDIENGVKAIIKKIRIFKKHHCPICGLSFIRRMQLKKHKRTHKLRRSKNISVDNLEETTTLELQDASELNQFIHDDNLSDEEDDEEPGNEIEIDQNCTEEMVESTTNSLEEPVTSASENSNLPKSSSTEDNADCNLDQIEEHSDRCGESVNEIVNSEKNEEDTKIEENTDEPILEDAALSLPQVSPSADVVLSENELSENNLESITNEEDFELSLNEEPHTVEEHVEDTANGNVVETSLETPADLITATNESAVISKECDSQSSLLKVNELPLNDLVFEEQNLITDQNECLVLDK